MEPSRYVVPPPSGIPFYDEIELPDGKLVVQESPQLAAAPPPPTPDALPLGAVAVVVQTSPRAPIVQNFIQAAPSPQSARARPRHWTRYCCPCIVSVCIASAIAAVILTYSRRGD